MDEADTEGVSQGNAEGEEPSSSGYRLVPWQSWGEWNMIREKLLSSSPESARVALNRIKAWESRGCLPIPVAITAEIVEARLTDPYFRKDAPNSGLNSEKVLSLLYSMAIMRLVNGFVDQSQDGTKKRLSIAKAAEGICLPRMLIDIRHESSHRGLPSLQLLRLAIDKALNWLRDYYWERQVKAIPDIFKDINSSLCKMAQCIKVKKVEVKKEVMKMSRSIILVYSSHSTEVATLLLEKCLSCKFGISDSEFISSVMPMDDDMLYLAGLDPWKLVIKKLSRKRTDLLLVMFKAALDKIDTFLSQNTEHDVQCVPFMTFQKQNHKIIENIASLACWLLERLKELVYTDSRNAGRSGVNDLVLRDTLEDLLCVCLGKLVSTSSILNSCLILSDLVGKGYLTELIRRLAQMGQPNESVVEIDKELGSEQEEASLNEAVKKLDILKEYRLRGKINVVHKEDVVWTVAKSWKPCPIGMLPSLSSAGRLPMLDKASKVLPCPETIKTSCKRCASHELQELGLRSNKKRESSKDRLSETSVEFETDEFVHDESELHESKMMIEGGSPEQSLSPLKGKLLIDGYLQHCGPDMLQAIQSKEIGNLTELLVLDIGYNEFVGPLPEALGRLKKLELNVAHKQLSGKIPAAICQLPALQNFTYSYNFFVREPPACLNLPKQGALVVSDEQNCILDWPEQRPREECLLYLRQPVDCANFSCFPPPPAALPLPPRPSPQLSFSTIGVESNLRRHRIRGRHWPRDRGSSS